ncbi:hypothetical protein [Caenispirillum salinarum]|uniref:hypothetical protein n=1 Tax=Caenispirillum salinarum TaxID=859058 RepID=UPI00384D2C9B
MSRTVRLLAVATALVSAGLPARAAGPEAVPSQVAALTEQAPADRSAEGLAIAAAASDRRCTRPDSARAARTEHPAYEVVHVLCNHQGRRGRLMTVRLFQSGRVAVRAEGIISLGEEGMPPAGQDYPAF